MSKLGRLLFNLVLVLVLCSCGVDSSSGGKATKKDNTNKQVGNKTDKQGRRNKSGKKGGKGKFDKGDEEDEVVVINVESENVSRGDAALVFKTTTILEADLESAVTSKASGIVLKINVEVGDKVEAGDILAVLESDVQQLRLQSAQATYQKSHSNYERAKSLLKKGLTNQESVDNLKFETKSLKTNLDQAKLDVDFTQIRAPISGVVTKRSIKKGNLIQLNTAVYQIVDFESLQAIINVPENKWSMFEEGLEVLLQFANLDEIIIGSILRVDPVVDSSTGTFKVVIALDQNKAKLRPGLFGKTQIILDKHQDTLLLTKNAIIREDNNAYVYVIQNDNTVVKTSLELGYEMDDSVEILVGLEENQQVVTTGKNNVSAESTVEVIEYND